jgi:predicted transposase YbfD/YdcC
MRRKREHELVPLLLMSVCAMLCGARSLYAVAQWGRERREDDPEALTPLGLKPGKSPSHATLRRVFKRLDVELFERILGEWLSQTGLRPEGKGLLAVDGKTLRGIHGEEVPGVHLVAVYSIQAEAVLMQVAVAEKKASELTATKAALSAVDLRGQVVAGDALQTQREVCETVFSKGGDLFPVKDNQKALRADLEAAFQGIEAALKRGQGEIPPYQAREWQEEGVVFERHRDTAIGHGRLEEREIWTLSDPEINGYAGSAGTVGTAWPPLSQITRLLRKRTVKGKTTTEIVYWVTSLTPEAAGAKDLLTYIRDYWEIENRLHWVRDVTFGEDHSQVRSGNAPQVKAALTNLALTLLRRNGHNNIAAALRTFAARSRDAVALVLSAHLF